MVLEKTFLRCQVAILINKELIRHRYSLSLCSGELRMCGNEECQKLGVEFVPACLKNKGKQWKLGGEPSSGKKEQLWEPEESGGEDSDSGDSMSDLYPAHMFTKKTTDAGENGDFQSDSGEEMEVEESVNSHRKRPQKQTGPSSKRLKSRHKKSKNVKKSAK
ncbi:surfeit locus protein 2-like [Mantella aurantiaca]